MTFTKYPKSAIDARRRPTAFTDFPTEIRQQILYKTFPRRFENRFLDTAFYARYCDSYFRNIRYERRDWLWLVVDAWKLELKKMFPTLWGDITFVAGKVYDDHREGVYDCEGRFIGVESEGWYCW
jgi:hypothetical protein